MQASLAKLVEKGETPALRACITSYRRQEEDAVFLVDALNAVLQGKGIERRTWTMASDLTAAVCCAIVLLESRSTVVSYA